MGSWMSRCICCVYCQRQCKENSRKSRKESAETLAADCVLNNIPEKKYSWDSRPKVNPENYTLSNLDSVEKIKRPGEINGQQFIIRNCKNSKIYLFDHTSTVSIDDCSDVLIVCGPSAQSVFIRDTKNSTLVCASSQLRLRDCQDIHLFVACESDPIIEASCGIVVGPYFLHYTGIEDHFISSQLSNFKTNRWSEMYDFTPNENSPNWTRYTKIKHRVEKYVCSPSPIEQGSTDESDEKPIEMTIDEPNSWVPVVYPIEDSDGEKQWRKIAVTFSVNISEDARKDFNTLSDIAMTFYKEMATKVEEQTNGDSDIVLSIVDMEYHGEEQRINFTYNSLDTGHCLQLLQDVKSQVVTLTQAQYQTQANNIIRITRKN